jgi:hypothetical protein
LVTAGNTVLVPVKIAGDAFRVDAFNGSTGAFKYSVGSDYILPAHNWIPVYNPCITTGAFGTRMYYAGAGGTIWHIDNPDSNTPGPPVREVFYSSAAYNSNPAAYNSTVFVNTPITADAAGNIYFGFRVQGTAPAPLNTQSGFARISPGGFGIYVLAGTAAGDAAINQVSHNLAPALSNDGNTLYVVARGASNSKLMALDPTDLHTRSSVLLTDPRNGVPARISDDGTAAPMVAPDGDVYFGVLGNPSNPSNGSRGFLLRFSGDLSIVKTPGGFGWDYTAGIVPASAVPAYAGSSTYLLFCKYNDYAFADGNGINRVALLDPNDTQLDPHSSSVGLVEMREVLTVIGPTQDPGPNHSTFPYAVKEWCINAPAVNPATKSVFFTSEDGRSYRWNLLTNTLDQAVVLTQGIGEPYVPTVIGPDGTVYTLNGGTLFALGNVSGIDVTISSSSPDLRNTVVGSPITFTVSVTGSPAGPGGTVTFTDFTYNGTTPITTTLATNVPLNNGQASVTTSSLTAGGNFLGNHFITASYSGDANHPASSATMMQKVHANASTTALVSSPNPSSFGQAVSFTATVSAVPSGAGTPTGMVTFQDGATVIGQVPLTSAGVVCKPTDSARSCVASITKSNLVPGNHNITATYVSDTQFAASIGNVAHVVQNGTATTVTSSFNPSSFGQSVMFTASVTPTNAAPGIPTGSVTFKDGPTVLGTVQLAANGQASLSTSALSVGSHTISADFTGSNGWLNSSGTVAQVVNEAPVLLPELNTQIAIALDSVTQTRDPFSLINPNNLSSDSRRRVAIFVWRLGLLPSDKTSDVSVLAEDDQGRVYDLAVEYIGPLSGVSEVTQVVVRLPDNVVGAPRDLLVKVGLRGAVSNKAIIRIAAP